MMAQAARLSLRMQKELKLLLSDPPPGASFPLLSPDSELSSLSSIDAQIEGPEGTVYAEGLFRIRIQIPDRYPFQPPSVTFATPIYHPNIDNGGRICLDILNLPPKGAWQPSLNISTVLTSIGLLLSEPNPDDGLMCEVSKEYKYNRQAFEQKARSLTQKYAKDGASGSGWGCQSDQNDFKTSTVEVDNAGRGSSHVVDENVLGHKKCGTKWKLSLVSSGLIHHRDGDGIRNDLPNEYILPSKCRNRVENEEAKEASKGMNDNCGQSQDKLCGTSWKLSQEVFDEFQKKDDNDKENQVPKWSLSSEALELSVASSRSSRLKADNHHDDQEQDSKPMENRLNVIAKGLTVVRQQSLGASDACQISYGFSEEVIVNHCKFDSNASYEASPILQAVNYIKQLHKDSSNCMGSGYGDLNCKTPCSSRKRLSLGFRDSSETQGKNRLRPSKVSSTSSFTFNEKGSEIASLDANRKKRRIVGKLSQGPLSQSQQSEDDEEQLLKHSQKPSEDPSKALHMQQDSRCDDKLKSNNDEDCRIDEGIKRQKTDESPMPDSVIVLDSEDSDVEEDVSSRSKSLLARKRIGKWRAKA